MSDPAKPEGPSRDQAHLVGLPDTLPITWCPNCKADVQPKGKGSCPRCGRLLRGAFLARRRPVNILRRDVLLQKLVADYQPTTTRLQAACEHLAGVLEQLEDMKPGTQEHKRLVELAQAIGDTLEQSQKPAPPPPVLTSASEDELIARLTRTLGCLIRAREFDELPFHPLGVDGGPGPDDADPAAQASRVSPVNPDPVCKFCQQSSARCVELKATRLDTWRLLHRNDPAEQKRRADERADESMKEMFESMRRANGGDPWVR